jgi:hypothetical protein
MAPGQLNIIRRLAAATCGSTTARGFVFHSLRYNANAVHNRKNNSALGIRGQHKQSNESTMLAEGKSIEIQEKR